MNTELLKRGKVLSKMLRHKPEQFGITLDQNGWANIEDVLKATNLKKEELDYIVENDDKQRFAYSDDKQFIRANQGHSVEVDVGLKERTPPDILFHGTTEKTVTEIMNNGIKKMGRNYVHLSQDKETAIKVGSRRGEPTVFIIDAKQMYVDGIKFYISQNGVWLTNYVDPKYIEIIKEGYVPLSSILDGMLKNL